MTAAEALEWVLQYMRVLAWPGIVLVVFLLLRHRIGSLIDRLSAAKGWGIEAEFRQQAEAFPEERTVSQEEYDELVRD